MFSLPDSSWLPYLHHTGRLCSCRAPRGHQMVLLSTVGLQMQSGRLATQLLIQLCDCKTHKTGWTATKPTAVLRSLCSHELISRATAILSPVSSKLLCDYSKTHAVEVDPSKNLKGKTYHLEIKAKWCFLQGLLCKRISVKRFQNRNQLLIIIISIKTINHNQ